MDARVRPVTTLRTQLRVNLKKSFACGADRSVWRLEHWGASMQRQWKTAARAAGLAACLGLILPACLEGRQRNSEEEALFQSLVTEAAADAAGSCSLAGDRLEVRATSYSNFTFCDLATGARIEARSGAGWEMSFQRFKLGTNSGESGAGAGGACKTGLTDFAAVNTVSQFGGGAAPDCPNFSTDAVLQGESGGAGGSTSVTFSGSPALLEWFSYNIFNHTLRAKSDVYIVRDSSGARYWKIQLLDYYNSAGVAGFISLRRQEISL
jgi:HmuY protein